jgi:hypothetical protein
MIALTWSAAIAMVVMLGVWAVAPRSTAFVPTTVLAQAQADPAANAATAPLNADVFSVNLWRDPPAVVAAKPVVRSVPVPAAQTLQLELLGITRRNASLQANLYDSRDDRIVIVGEGDHVRRFTVNHITSDAVEMSDGRQTYTLALEEGPA